MISGQLQPAFWALTVKSAEEAGHLYFDPLRSAFRSITVWSSILQARRQLVRAQGLLERAQTLAQYRLELAREFGRLEEWNRELTREGGDLPYVCGSRNCSYGHPGKSLRMN